MSRILSALCTLVFIVAFTPSMTRADPIFITSGTLTVTGAVGGPHFSLSGNGFSATGGGERGFLALQTGCIPCTSGSVVTVNALFIGSSLGMDFTGSLSFSGPPITVPFTLTSLTLTSPFVFSGTLGFCPQGCFFGPPESIFTLTGGGTATFDLVFSGLTNQGVPIFTFRNITYNFEVPEPTSILLLGGGLAALAGTLRRRMRL